MTKYRMLTVSNEDWKEHDTRIRMKPGIPYKDVSETKKVVALWNYNVDTRSYWAPGEVTEPFTKEEHPELFL